MALYDSPTQGGGQTGRLLLVLVACGLVLLGSDYLTQAIFGRHVLGTPVKTLAVKPVTAPVTAPVAVVADAMPQRLSTTLIEVQNTRTGASLTTEGATFNTLTLKQYREEITDPHGYLLLSERTTSGTAAVSATAVVMGWQGAGIEGPTHATNWQAVASATTPTFTWANSTGQRFTRTFKAVPDSYIWRVTERVENTAALPVTLTPYAQVVRHGGYVKTERSNWVNYFGPMGLIAQGTETLLKETSFSSLKKETQSEAWNGTGGWWGITAQYFLTAILPDSTTQTTRQFAYRNEVGTEGGQDIYTAGVQFAPATVAPAGATEITYSIYAGPKHYPMLIEAGSGLEQAISWGWFEPLVKGLYHVLVAVHALVPNWGVAVMILTLLLKIATFPLANTSYRAMAKMKKLQPEIERMKAKNGENQQAMAAAMMGLYKEHKVNPLSGCWPMLIQIPIFFAMYKVVLVMFEFRHASFLWMPDLAVHDPFYVLPIAMGISMWVQFKLNPTPTDPVQEMMFKWMPLMMTVMFLWFPAGLVLYWLTNNVLSIGQQYFIFKRAHVV